MTRRISPHDWELLSLYLDRQLRPSEQSHLEARLQQEPELQSMLEELRSTRDLLRQAPRLRAPRSFALRPEQVGARSSTRSAARPYPAMALGFVSALASLALVVVLAGDLLGRPMAQTAYAPNFDNAVATEVAQQLTGMTLQPAAPVMDSAAEAYTETIDTPMPGGVQEAQLPTDGWETFSSPVTSTEDLMMLALPPVTETQPLPTETPVPVEQPLPTPTPLSPAEATAAAGAPPGAGDLGAGTPNADQQPTVENDRTASAPEASATPAATSTLPAPTASPLLPSPTASPTPPAPTDTTLLPSPTPTPTLLAPAASPTPDALRQDATAVAAQPVVETPPAQPGPQSKQASGETPDTAAAQGTGPGQELTGEPPAQPPRAWLLAEIGLASLAVLSAGAAFFFWRRQSR
jgi:hypothetical protein